MFDELPVVIENEHGRRVFRIANPENIQLDHVQNIQQALLKGTAHPSTGVTAAHTSWVMDQILGNE